MRTVFSQDEKRRKRFFGGERPPIELGDVYDTKCRNCGGHGKQTTVFSMSLKTDAFNENLKIHKLVSTIDQAQHLNQQV